MKTIIAGSRSISDKEIVYQAIEESGFKITKVVSGRCFGVDMIGEQWAAERSIPVIPFPAKWSDLSHSNAIIRTDKCGRKYDAMAGPRRNMLMAGYADALILVYDGKSKGATSMLRLAEKHGLQIFVKKVK